MNFEVEIFNKLITENILEYFKEYKIIENIPLPKSKNLKVAKTTEDEIFFTINYLKSTNRYKITWQLFLAEGYLSINKN